MAKLYYKDGTPVFITHKVDIVEALRSGQVTLEDPTKAKARKPIEAVPETESPEVPEVRQPVKKRKDPVEASFGISKRER
jgi:hypothetical protein